MVECSVMCGVVGIIPMDLCGVLCITLVVRVMVRIRVMW